MGSEEYGVVGQDLLYLVMAMSIVDRAGCDVKYWQPAISENLHTFVSMSNFSNNTYNINVRM